MASLTPQGLGQLFSLPPEAVIPGMRLQEQMQMDDDMARQKTLADMQFSQQANPLKLQQMQMGLDTDAAQLPGIIAEAGSKKLKYDRDWALKDEDLAAARTALQGKVTKQHYDQMLQAGPVMRNAAEVIRQQPVGGVNIAKKMFDDAGIGYLWDEGYSNTDYRQLAPLIDRMGTAFQQNVPKLYDALQTTGAKAELARGLQDDKQSFAAQQQTERLNAAAARSTEANRVRTELAKKDGGSLKGIAPEKLAGHWMMLAAQARVDGDAEEAARYEAEGAKALAARAFYGSQGSQAPQLNPEAVGGGLLQTPAPRVNPLEPAPVAPAAAAGALPAEQIELFKQAFKSYEPTKYTYRLGPNGVPQRKLKGN